MRKKILLSGGRSLLASYSLASHKVRRWVVFVSESGADFQEGSRSELRVLLGPKLMKKYNYLALNKPGLLPKKTVAAVFEKSFRRELRIKDALKTMNEIIPAGHEVVLVGYSEGAYLAPQIARHDSRVIAMIMIGGGTRGWLKEELSHAGPRERRALKKQFRDIYRHPKSLKKWNAFSYATWYSYRGDDTLKALEKLEIPTLAILGARDRTIDLKSAVQDLRKLMKKKPIELKVFGACGHSFVSHWADAWHEVRLFLADI
jgi:dienelactone hydrolase